LGHPVVRQKYVANNFPGVALNSPVSHSAARGAGEKVTGGNLPIGHHQHHYVGSFSAGQIANI